jgi:hypothetical protein
MMRVLRCAACTRRIKGHHPHIGLLDMATGKEIAAYHARGGCQQRAGQEIAGRLERGKAYVLRHYHASTCPDEHPGWGCTGGCFDEPMAVAN